MKFFKIVLVAFIVVPLFSRSPNISIDLQKKSTSKIPEVRVMGILKNEAGVPVSSSGGGGGGCTYNPENTKIDMMYIVLLLLAMVYLWKSNLFKNTCLK